MAFTAGDPLNLGNQTLGINYNPNPFLQEYPNQLFTTSAPASPTTLLDGAVVPDDELARTKHCLLGKHLLCVTNLNCQCDCHGE